MDIFTLILHQPIYNLVIVFYSVLGNLGWAIIAIALLSRIVTIPITIKQIKNAQKSQEMNELVKEIKRKYKNDKEKQAQEMLKVQSEYLPGQLTGCLSVLLQTILLITVYHVITSLLSTNWTADFDRFAYDFVRPLMESGVINGQFLGGLIDLGQVPGKLVDPTFLQLVTYGVLAILVGVTQFFSTRILMGMRSNKKTNDKKEDKQKKKAADDEMPDFAEIMQQSTRQTMVIFPLLLLFMSWNFPAGLSLYWTVQSGFVIIQQLLIGRLTKDKDGTTTNK